RLHGSEVNPGWHACGHAVSDGPARSSGRAQARFDPGCSEEAALDGVGGCDRPGRCPFGADLCVDRRNMAFDGSPADKEVFSDLLVALSPRHETEHLTFASGEPGQCFSVPGGRW